ncbi:LLM class F420-dependent oxidoreductase [Agromyces sp. NPDC049794]|uniref:LLM class F420-dependent oxidoreductase n=1 Tax=unclassified Agromyces TaxID=2639701 RepID=UPI0033DBBA6D
MPRASTYPTHTEAPMDLGIHYWNFTHPDGDTAIAPHLAATAKAADDAGLALFSVMDHFFQIDQMLEAEDPMLDAYTALGFVAGHTMHIPLATVVTGVTYRHPALLAKAVTTLDVLSGGRAWLGIGAAWYEREHLGLGVPFPSLAERFERLEETLRICLQMWSDDDGVFEGTHYRLAETLNRPRALGRPHPPVLIGGTGERKTLRLVAKYADVWNVNVTEPDEIRHKIDVLRAHCEREGRDIRDIRITAQGGPLDPAADPDGFLRHAEILAELGIQHIQVRVQQPDPVGFVGRIADDVLPRLREIRPVAL